LGYKSGYNGLSTLLVRIRPQEVLLANMLAFSLRRWGANSVMFGPELGRINGSTTVAPGPRPPNSGHYVERREMGRLPTGSFQ